MEEGLLKSLFLVPCTPHLLLAATGVVCSHIPRELAPYIYNTAYGVQRGRCFAADPLQ